MHAVVVRVTINDTESAEEVLRTEVVPRVSQSPGFVCGYWTRKDDEGLSMIVVESEEQARGLSEQIPATLPGAVTLANVEVREVVASA